MPSIKTCLLLIVACLGAALAQSGPTYTATFTYYATGNCSAIAPGAGTHFNVQVFMGQFQQDFSVNTNYLTTSSYCPPTGSTSFTFQVVITNLANNSQFVQSGAAATLLASAQSSSSQVYFYVTTIIGLVVTNVVGNVTYVLAPTNPTLPPANVMVTYAITGPSACTTFIDDWFDAEFRYDYNINNGITPITVSHSCGSANNIVAYVNLPNLPGSNPLAMSSGQSYAQSFSANATSKLYQLAVIWGLQITTVTVGGSASAPTTAPTPQPTIKGLIVSVPSINLNVAFVGNCSAFQINAFESAFAHDLGLGDDSTQNYTLTCTDTGFNVSITVANYNTNAILGQSSGVADAVTAALMAPKSATNLLVSQTYGDQIHAVSVTNHAAQSATTGATSTTKASGKTNGAATVGASLVGLLAVAVMAL